MAVGVGRVENTVIESVELEPDGGGEMVVALVRPTRSRRGRCGRRSVMPGVSTVKGEFTSKRRSRGHHGGGHPTRRLLAHPPSAGP